LKKAERAATIVLIWQHTLSRFSSEALWIYDNRVLLEKIRYTTRAENMAPEKMSHDASILEVFP
jgi:hypothetical protein